MVSDLRRFLDDRLARISAKSRLAKTNRYELSRWDALTLFVADGQVKLDNNSVERSIRPLR